MRIHFICKDIYIHAHIRKTNRTYIKNTLGSTDKKNSENLMEKVKQKVVDEKRNAVKETFSKFSKEYNVR